MNKNVLLVLFIFIFIIALLCSYLAFKNGKNERSFDDFISTTVFKKINKKNAPPLSNKSNYVPQVPEPTTNEINATEKLPEIEGNPVIKDRKDTYTPTPKNENAPVPSKPKDETKNNEKILTLRIDPMTITSLQDDFVYLTGTGSSNSIIHILEIVHESSNTTLPLNNTLKTTVGKSGFWHLGIPSDIFSEIEDGTLIVKASSSIGESNVVKIKKDTDFRFDGPVLKSSNQSNFTVNYTFEENNYVKIIAQQGSKSVTKSFNSTVQGEWYVVTFDLSEFENGPFTILTNVRNSSGKQISRSVNYNGF